MITLLFSNRRISVSNDDGFPRISRLTVLALEALRTEYFKMKEARTYAHLRIDGFFGGRDETQIVWLVTMGTMSMIVARGS
jgi:hypothetical protein